jgi:hypothetical protein
MREFGPMTDEILPIQIREDKSVYIQGIPHDLTSAEAQKIANIVIANVNPPNDTKEAE